MADNVTLDQLAARLRALPREISGARGGPLRAALRAVANDLRRDVAARAPRKTGMIARSATVKMDPNPQQHNGANERFIVSIRRGRKRGDGAYYAGFVHWGTRPGKQGPKRAQPWIRKMFAQRGPHLTNEIKDELVKGMDRAVARAKRAG